MEPAQGLKADFLDRGWCRFGADPALAAWAAAVLPAARAAVAAPANAHWWRCGGTWFVGVNALPNGDDGAVAGGPPLAGRAVDFVRRDLGLDIPWDRAWDRAQVSVCRPGYPRPWAGESEAALRYRRRRDAAHVDGLLAEGPDRRRHPREAHAFILGIPLAAADPGASPFVVWEGSHHVIRAALAERLAGLDPAAWGGADVTGAYHAARRRAFAACPRVELPARPGEAYLAHRLALHGMAPWAPGAAAGADGRMVAYFRPPLSTPAPWLHAP